MSTRTSLVIVLSLAACGGGQKPLRVDDSRLARLPSESRQVLLDVERPVRAAEIDLEGAQVAERDAKSFQSTVAGERDAARRQVDEAQRALKAAQERQRAADAKAEYAEELAAFRGDIVQRRKAELDALRAEAEVQKVQQLLSAGQPMHAQGQMKLEVAAAMICNEERRPWMTCSEIAPPPGTTASTSGSRSRRRTSICAPWRSRW